MDLDGRVKKLERLQGCSLCLDATGNHKRDKCNAKTKSGEAFRNSFRLIIFMASNPAPEFLDEEQSVNSLMDGCEDHGDDYAPVAD